MRNFKYREPISGGEIWEPLMKTIKSVRSSFLKDCANAFHNNMERIVAFQIMPAAIAFQARRDGVFTQNAILLAIKKGELTLEAALSQKTLPPSVAAAIKKQEEIFVSEVDKQHERFDVLGVQYIEDFLKIQQPDGQPMAMHDSMDAVLSAVVLESWTAFESLAGDLWVAGVDNEPGDAVANLTLAATSNKLKKPDDNLRPATVYRTGINPKEKYGSFLKAVGSVTFQTLRDIRTFYEIAFGESANSLFDDIDNGYIKALAAFRNVIIHAASKADQKFIDRIREIRDFDYIKPGDVIQLDGELVKKLNLAAARVGSALLAHIDNILSPPTGV